VLHLLEHGTTQGGLPCTPNQRRGRPGAHAAGSTACCGRIRGKWERRGGGGQYAQQGEDAMTWSASRRGKDHRQWSDQGTSQATNVQSVATSCASPGAGGRRSAMMALEGWAGTRDSPP
jgi:hypothetical protein